MVKSHENSFPLFDKALTDLEPVCIVSTLVDVGWYTGRLLRLHFEQGTQLPINAPESSCHRE